MIRKLVTFIVDGIRNLLERKPYTLNLDEIFSVMFKEPAKIIEIIKDSIERNRK